MTYSTTSDRGLTRRDSTFIKSHASKLADLPPPEEEWCEFDLPSYLGDNLRQYEKRSVIERVEDPSIDKASPVWRTNRNAWAAIQEYTENVNTLPCGHPGWTFTGEDEDPYKCTTCGNRHPREDVPE